MSAPHRIRIFIDHPHYDVELPSMTGQQLRALPSPPIGPDLDLWLDVPGPDDRRIANAEVVELREGMHFYTAPATINPGESPRLPERDASFLTEKGSQWSVVSGVGEAFLIITDFAVDSKKYDRGTTNLMLRLPGGYPAASLDMFYVDPPLMLRVGGFPPAANNFENHAGRRWQRFSRHLAAPWRAGVDCLRTFLAPIIDELKGRR